MNPNGMPPGIKPQGFFGKLVAVVAGTGLLVLGLMFSVIIIAVALAVGLAIWGWMWWKTRALRQRMREQMEAQSMQPPFGGDVDSGRATGGRIIEGEIIRDNDDAGTPRRD
jgi:hypothetical protein